MRRQAERDGLTVCVVRTHQYHLSSHSRRSNRAHTLATVTYAALVNMYIRKIERTRWLSLSGNAVYVCCVALKHYYVSECSQFTQHRGSTAQHRLSTAKYIFIHSTIHPSICELDTGVRVFGFDIVRFVRRMSENMGMGNEHEEHRANTVRRFCVGYIITIR